MHKVLRIAADRIRMPHLRGQLVTGPDHFREGERLLADSEDTSTVFKPDEAAALAAQAQAHFLAALTASHATHNHAQSTSWGHAINPTETL